jgi:pimeloyl-ACP methyl ester carboxylesterase
VKDPQIGICDGGDGGARALADSSPAEADIVAADGAHESRDWLREGWSRPATVETYRSDGALLAARCWNAAPSDAPALLFVHGFRANARWWDHIAPRFRDAFHVVAVDLAGHGVSYWRERYDCPSFARDILAAIDAFRLKDVTMVAHSYGGQPGLRAARSRPGAFRRLIILESRTNGTSPRRPQPAGTSRFTSPDEAVARFRFTPQARDIDPLLRDYVAKHSLRREGEGFRWAFDPAVIPYLVSDSRIDMYRPTGIPSVYVTGGQSPTVTPDEAERIAAAIGAERLITIPNAGHHIPLEAPRILFDLIEAEIRAPGCP